MTYSNTKRDKIQSGWWRRVLDVIIAVVLLVFMVISVSGGFRQWLILSQAWERNLKLEEDINRLEIENRILESSIAEATSTAYINRKMRDYFGIGTGNDYWIELPELAQQDNLSPEKVELPIPNFWQWWDLFTDHKYTAE